MALAIGIDLGTTNSAISYIDKNGKPTIIPNDAGKAITPSVICFKEDGYIIGEEAKEMQALGIYPIAAFFKREMGNNIFIFPVLKKDYSAIELSAIILKKLKKDAEKFLKQKVIDVVITVPAYFRDPERKATIEAGKMAGLNILQVINEPTAAAVSYGLTQSKKSSRMLVYDLGGGTFDVTLLEFGKNEVRVKNSDGDQKLGGKDWDDRLIDYIASKFQDEYGVDPLEDSESLADLLVQMESAKKRLTSSQKATISITHDGCKGRYEIERSLFEEMTADLMERTISLTIKVLEEVHLKPKDIDGILLVGGSTRMPMVHKFIEKKFSKSPMQGVNVDEAVALGAAIVANEQHQRKSPGSTFALSGKIKTIDVTNHSLGMIAINQDQSAYINSIILPKNAEIPCKDQRPYQHRINHKGDSPLEIYMTQGESESPTDVTYLGRYVVQNIPQQKAGIIVVDVSYYYNESGTVDVEAKDHNSNKALTISVESLPSDIPNRFLKAPEIIEEIEPVTAYLAFDLSGSMSGTPLEEAKKAAIAFLNNTDLSHCALGIIAFSDTVRTKLAASQNAKSITNAINELKACETGIGNGVHPFDEIYLLLNSVDGRRFGIVLADGAWSNTDTAIKQAKRCHNNDIDIISIGFGGAVKSFLDKIASSTEDSFFTSMTDLVNTFSSIAQVLTETGGGSTTKSSGKKAKQGMGLFSLLKGK